MTRSFYVYITTNKYRKVLYVGVTNNLARRIWEHEQGAFQGSSSFTGRYRVSYLVYYEVFSSPMEAIIREKEIKAWRREKKDSLISSVNPEWRFMNDDLDPQGW